MMYFFFLFSTKKYPYKSVGIPDSYNTPFKVPSEVTKELFFFSFPQKVNNSLSASMMESEKIEERQ